VAEHKVKGGVASFTSRSLAVDPVLHYRLFVASVLAEEAHVTDL